MMRNHLYKAALAVLFVGCSVGPVTLPPPVGSDEFTSAAVGGAAGSGTGNKESDAAAPSSGGTGATPRTVEEGDVYKVVGDQLYVLNMYRGLQIVDVTNPDLPVKQGTSPVFGWPVEMYVRDGYAYVIVSDYFTWQQGANGTATPFHGSQVRIVDVRVPTAPVVVGGIDLEGAISDTRIVGDVLYVVANRWAWYDNAASADDTNALVVSSIDLAQPAAPVLKASMRFEGTSNVIHVSPTTLYVASPEGDWSSPNTKVSVVDINDPAGALVSKGDFSVEGSVQQRFQLDEYGSYFRIVTHTGSWGQDGSQSLRVFDMSQTPASQVSTLSLPNTGGLFATRFEGERAYVVTMVSVDPLEVIDLSDPANPVLTHSLVIPGVLHQVVPMGDRLLALGTDNTWSGLAASLFDVADPKAPTMLSRVNVGSGSAWSNANWDDKALKVLATEGMMLVPFSGWEPPSTVVDPATGQKQDVGGTYVNGFQILTFDRQTLTAAGIVKQSGQVSRVTSHNARLLSISDRILQAVDATDRKNPVVTASLELARDVTHFVAVGSHAVTLSNDGWWWNSQASELRVTDLATPEGTVIGQLNLSFYASKLFADGDGVLVLGYPASWDGTLRAVRVDLTNPAQPAIVGSEVTIGQANVGNVWMSIYLDAARRVSSGVLAVPAFSYKDLGNGQWSSDSSVHVVDVAAGLQGVVSLGGPVAGELVVDGADLWASHQETLNGNSGQPLARFYADKIDFANVSAPTVSAKVNVPGTLVAVSGDAIFTRDYQWTAATPTMSSSIQHSLAECTLVGNRAVLRAYLTLDEGLGRIIADGRRLYATTQPWWWSGVTSNGVTIRVYSSTATAPLAEVSRTPVNDWLQLRALEGGHLFLGSGYWGGPWDYGFYGGGRGGPMADTATAGVSSSDVMYGYSAVNGLIDLSLADPDHPAYRQFIRTSGWVQGLSVVADTLYLSSGMYGIQSVALVP